MNIFRTAPNLLTLLRISLAPFLVAALLHRQFKLALLLFVIAGLTDGLDGLIAKVLHQQTTIGQYLDPIADKLLLSTLFVVLTYLGLIPMTVTVLVLGRDVGILAVAAVLYTAAGMRDFHPGIFGKANTVAQILAVSMVLLGQIYPSSWIAMGATIALVATIVLTIASSVQYAWRVIRRPAITG